jgi:hypothetical protein
MTDGDRGFQTIICSVAIVDHCLSWKSQQLRGFAGPASGMTGRPLGTPDSCRRSHAGAPVRSSPVPRCSEVLAALPLPVEPETCSMPADYRLGIDQHEGLAPLGPESREQPTKPDPIPEAGVGFDCFVVDRLAGDGEPGFRFGARCSQCRAKPGKQGEQHITRGSGRYQDGLHRATITIAAEFLVGTSKTRPSS